MTNNLTINKTVSVGRISYMNVAPIYYGLDNGYKPEWMKLITGTPTFLNKKLIEGKLDISPVSSVAYARNHHDWMVLPNLSISCFGNVMSVILASQYPIDRLDRKKLVLSDESATAADLLELICKKEQINPYKEKLTFQKPEELPKDTDAVLVIGDVALTENWNENFKYVWDLGKMWKVMTGLPFVFALWAVRRSFFKKNSELVASVVEFFNNSKKMGVFNMEQITELSSKKNEIDIDICRRYYSLLNCELGPQQVQGVEAFFEKLFEKNMPSEKVKINFANCTEK